MKTCRILVLFLFIPLFNNAQIEFYDETRIITEHAFYKYEFIDIDLDGDKDIIGTDTESIEWFENDGNGDFSNFSRPIILESFYDNFISDFNIEDYDNDGFLDISITYSESGFSGGAGAVSFYKNDGSTTFNLIAQLPFGSSQFRDKTVHFADIDEDGIKDIILSIGQTDALWYKNNGNLNFVYQGGLSIYYGGYISNTIDMNGDGFIDVLAGTSGTFELSIKDALGDFTTPYTFSGYLFDVFDYDSDGDMDLLALNSTLTNLELYSNDGSGNMTGPITIHSGTTILTRLRTADINMDNNEDILFCENGAGSNYVYYLENNFGTFNPAQNVHVGPGLYRSVFDFADINADDTLEVCMMQEISGSQYLTTYSMDSVFNFHENEVIRENHDDIIGGFITLWLAGPRPIDFGLDSTMEFFLSNGVWKDEGDYMFTGDLDTLASTVYTKLVDVDLDGDLDRVGKKYVGTPYFDDVIFWRENDGANQFGPEIILSAENTSGSISQIGFLDLDADGDLDLIFTVDIGNPCELYYCFNTVGVFGQVYEWGGGLLTSQLNGNIRNLITNNGVVDSFDIQFAFVDSYGDELYVQLFNQNTLISVQQNIDDYALLDMDDDDLLDILVVDGALKWYKNNGVGGFNYEGDLPVNGGGLYRLKLQDMDFDLDDDLILFYDSAGVSSKTEYKEYLSPGNYGVDHFLVNQGYKVLFADMDFDSDMDILVGSSTGFGGILSQHKSSVYSEYQILGNLFYDENQNQIKDTFEIGILGSSINNSTSNVNEYTNTSGDFLFNVVPDSYLIQPNTISGWSLYTDSTSYSVSPSVSEPTIDSLYFGFIPDSLYSTVNVELITSDYSCNSESVLWISNSNTGTESISGYIQLDLDTSIIFISSVPPPDSIVGDQYYWHYDSISLFNSNNIELLVQMPDSSLNGSSIVSLVSSFIFDANDSIISADYDSLIMNLTCTQNPIIKEVEPIGESSEGYILNNTDLEYTIKFRNNGTDTVQHVKIIDQLTDNLDYFSVSIIGSSHPVDMTYEFTGKIVFDFYNINLPDSIADYNNSHGFIKFKISQLPDLQPGEEIVNSAKVIYDNSSYALTNSVLNTIYECVDEVPLSLLPDPMCEPIPVDILINSNTAYDFQWFINNSSVSTVNSYTYVPGVLDDTLHVIMESPDCYMDTILVLTSTPTPSPYLGPNDTITTCEDELLFISAYPTHNSWVLNGVTVSIDDYYIAQQSGQLLHVNMTGGCYGVDEVNLIVLPLPDVTVTQTGAFTFQTVFGYPQYQWVDCNNFYAPVNGFQSSYFTAYANGEYAVVTTSLDNCSDTSDCIIVSTISLADIDAHIVMDAYPNPTKGELNVSFSGNQSVILKVRTADGKLVQEHSVNNQDQFVIDLSSLSPGFFLIEIIGKEGSEILRVIKE
ncbi:MAG: T9SS type A sorting domain-containing protein [Crocinitomicaceae bacterium]|nr:T9SS type A sorting domain-containing protein [Crocinitomicaceae bacterium]